MGAEDTARFELFVDESGTFDETSSDPFERARGTRQRFPSQLAGVLAPRGAVTKPAAEEVLASAARAAGVAFHGTLHGSEVQAGPAFDALVLDLLDGLAARGWSPVRLVNRERVSFGDRAANYTNMLAELCARVLDHLRGQGHARVELSIVAARVVRAETARGLEFLERDEYSMRLQEAVTRITIRRGHAATSRASTLGRFRIASARTEPELGLADLVSNASHADFAKLGEPARTRVRRALEPLDFTLDVREGVEAVRALLDHGALGLAVVHGVEQLSDPDLEAPVRDTLRTLLRRAVAELGDLGAPARDPQLQLVASWLSQEVAHGRDLDGGRRECQQVVRDVSAPLRRRLESGPDAGSVDWFEYLLHRLALTASNHLGDLRAARHALDAMHPLEPRIVARWEHVDLFVDAQHHEAVHLTDARAYDDAIAIATRTARFYDELGSLFQAAMPDRFPARVHADRRGEALGTAMQAAMYAGADDPARFDDARRWNDEAMAEFGKEHDRRRQMQYRCQLETLAGCLDDAWSWLARAVGLDPSASVADVARSIAARTDEDPDRRFLLLHAYRLGAAAARHAHRSAEEFVAAFESMFATDPWVNGDRAHHPAPAIQRYRCELLLAVERIDAATGTLQRLRTMCLPLGSSSPILAFDLVSAQALLARDGHRTAPARTRLLLDCRNPDQPGLRQLVDRLATLVEGAPALESEVARWRGAVERALTDPADGASWSQLGVLATRASH